MNRVAPSFTTIGKRYQQQQSRWGNKMKRLLFLLLIASIVCAFRLRHFSFQLCKVGMKQRLLPTARFVAASGILNEENVGTLEKQRFGREILSYLMTPTDENSPFFDPQKATTRSTILATASYSALKIELLRRGLDTSGDKEEMLIRLALHFVDPESRYTEDSPDLDNEFRYVTEADVGAGYVIQNSPEEIAALKEADLGPDADDAIVFRKQPKIRAASSYLAEGKRLIPDRSADYGFMSGRSVDDLILDHLDRKIVLFPPMSILRPERSARREDIEAATQQMKALQAYVVGCKDLTVFKMNGAAVILFPNELGWTSREMRELADELAEKTQTLIILPDLYRNHSSNSHNPRNSAKGSSKSSPWLQELDYKQVFDDFLATCNFFYQEYPIHSFSFVGVGYGGGKVLQLANDLYALANHGVYDDILAKEAAMKSSPGAVAEVVKGFPAVLQDPSSPAYKQLNKFHIWRHAPGRVLHPKARRANSKKKLIPMDSNNNHNATSASATVDPTNQYNYDEFVESVTSTPQESDATKKSVKDQELEELVERGELSPELAEALQDMEAEEESETEKERSSSLLSGEEEAPVEPIIDFGRVERAYPDPNELLRSPEYDELIDGVIAENMNVSTSTLKKLMDSQEKAQCTHPFITHPLFEAIRGEDPDLLQPGSRMTPTFTEENKLALLYHWPEKEIVTNWRITERLAKYARARFKGSQLFSSPTSSPAAPSSSPFSTPTQSMLFFSPKDFQPFVPRCVVALCPQDFNAAMVGKFSYLPTRVISAYHPNRNSSEQSQLEELKLLHNGLLSHRDEILDYDFTVFTNVTSRFIVRPKTEYEKYLFWEATRSAHEWIDLFSARSHKNILPIAGYTKYSEKAFLISPLPDPATFREMQSFYYESFVAKWVHDPAKRFKIRVEDHM